ncbi:unnamed protein product [Chondrus crispus]|uniref:N-acetyltransferase domain-containing protein n=1 Tax=Chondrus crispus TaxID=2769 RepID=R7QTB4_CHOCR|nr:unnamed protein product [Chondrus crispus]CDF40751.1 unnamed protein product [Chondrus crispus]|eukprot:XP_005711045.1 unnamed protein product [Chondrus crispus]
MNIQEQCVSTSVRYRHYKAQDYDDVVELCRNVYGGKDYLPRILEALPSDPLCSPRVICQGDKVVAFCNLRFLESDADSHHVAYIEAVRVSEDNRRQGLATRIVQETMDSEIARVNSPNPVRFLSTTGHDSVAMPTIFERAGWARRGLSLIWPSDANCNAIRNSSADVRGRYLDLLKVSSFIPLAAKQCISRWRQLHDSRDILLALQDLRARGGCFLLPQYYSLNTATGASKFLQSQFSKQERREVWRLERDDRPPVTIFISVKTAAPSNQQPDQFVSVCAADVSGVECCIAFLASQEQLTYFRISLDPLISLEDMKKSPLLSKAGFSGFLIFEATK